MSKKKKRNTPAAAPAEPAKAEHTQPEEPAVSSTARWMGALCYLSILILIPACTKWRQDEFVRFHLNQGLMVLMLATICAALGFVPVLALIILFQDEIRRFLLTLGSHQHASALVRFFTGNKKESMEHDEIMPVVMACISMGKQKVGALIVIEHNMPLDDVVRTGEVINADINQRLIENIFFKNSPLHDGAMVISKKRIKAAGCILPVSHNLDIPKELGLRHRAAMGISQVSDAHAVIVSEETGSISVAYKGQFYLRLSAEELERLLTKEI